MIGQAKRLYELNSLFHSKSEIKGCGKIVSFTSGKGGTGKSFVSSNMAYELASTGSKVLLIDFDINLSNIGVLFNVSSKKNLFHYFTYDYSLEEVIFNHSQNLDIIFGESGRVDHPELTEEKVNLFLNELKIISSNYDYLLIDTASGISNSTLQILNHSDEIILVTTSEPTSVMDAYVIIKMLKSMENSSLVNIIVNKTFELNEGIIAFENLNRAVTHFLKFNINYMGNIPFAAEVVKSIQNQSLLLKLEKYSPVALQIKEITSKINIPAIG
jgi:flagellar biosynthesis protein FlhG